MPFVAIEPLKKQTSRTGVRTTKSDRVGLTVSLSDAALEALESGGGDVERVNLLLDWDPVMPRIRIVASAEGKFALGVPNGRAAKSKIRIIRVGHRTEWEKSDEIRSADCLWESPQPGTVDIELPRELRPQPDKVSIGKKDVSVAPVPSARS